MVYISGSNLICEKHSVYEYTISYKKNGEDGWDLFNDFKTKSVTVQFIQTLIDNGILH